MLKLQKVLTETKNTKPKDSIDLGQLIHRIAEYNDKKAFSIFFDLYYTRLMNLAMLYLPQYEQAEEIVSNVFLKILENREKLKTVTNIKGYLFIMVKNASLNYLKSKKRDNGNYRIDDIKDHLSTDFIDPEKKLINDDLRMALNMAIHRLPPKRRMVFKLVKDEGLSYKEAAAILDLSDRTIEVHLKLAIQDLRKLLQVFFDE